MSEKEPQSEWPFEFAFDQNVSWDDLTINVELAIPATDETKEIIENILEEWAERGISEGYGKGKIHSWDTEENEWDKRRKKYRFWVDMGSSDENTSLTTLFDKLTNITGIKRIKLS